MGKLTSTNVMWIAVSLFCFIAGIMCGTYLQQQSLTKSAVMIAEGLEGTTFNIEIDLNETKLVEDFTEIFIPIFNQTLNNQSIVGDER